MLALPATLWWVHRQHYARHLWWSIGGCIGLMWLWEYYTMYYAGNLETLGLSLPTPFSLVGLGCTLWLLLEGWNVSVTNRD